MEPTKPDAPHQWEFVDGPLRGFHNFKNPIDSVPGQVKLPITKDLKLCPATGMPAGYAFYERRLDGDRWKWFHLETNTSAEAADVIFSNFKEHELKQGLALYTSSQLMDELLNRETFVGVIVCVKGSVTSKFVSHGSPIEIGLSKFFDAAQKNAIVLLENGIEALKTQLDR